METDFLHNVQIKLCASGNHYSNEGEAIFYTVTFLLLLETIFYGFFLSFFFEMFLPMQVAFGIVEMYLFNLYFVLAGGIRV